MQARPRLQRALGVLVLSLILCGCASTHWSNYLGEQAVHGTGHAPGSALEVLELVQAVALEDEGGNVRAVGAGHASSDVARPREGQAWISVDDIDEIEDWPYYRQGNDSARFVRVGAGKSIRDINRALADLEPRRALFNMGNYDEQTIAGAFSTGTHGSGLNHGPLTDRIVAIEMVTDERLADGQRVQRLLRIEPSDGVTDRARFDAGHATYGDADEPIRVMVLEQDDGVFDAVLINLGAFGIITGVTVETRPSFWLRETEELVRWDRGRLPDVEEMAYANPEFLQLTLVPHRILDDGGSHVGEVMYIRTVRSEERDCDRRPPHRPLNRETLGRIVGALGGTGILEDLGLSDPWTAQRAILTTFEERAGAEDDFLSRSDHVLINSLAPFVTATSIDIQVPLEHAAAAIDRVVALAEERETSLPGPLWEEWWHTSPIGIRFVAESRALIAPSFDGPVVSIEIPLLYGKDRSTRDAALHRIYRSHMFDELERELTGPEFGGRPHWGQRNRMTAPLARAMYGDNWDCWVANYRRFNGNGTFDNAFTDRMCLSNTERSECDGIAVAGVCGVDDPPGSEVSSEPETPPNVTPPVPTEAAAPADDPPTPEEPGPSDADSPAPGGAM